MIIYGHCLKCITLSIFEINQESSNRKNNHITKERVWGTLVHYRNAWMINWGFEQVSLVTRLHLKAYFFVLIGAQVRSVFTLHSYISAWLVSSEAINHTSNSNTAYQIEKQYSSFNKIASRNKF